MTTFRKLPMSSPNTRQVPTKKAGDEARRSIADIVAFASKENAARGAASAAVDVKTASSDDRAQLEDRQVHGDHEAADEHAEDGHDHRLEEARHGVDGIVDFGLVERG